MDFSHFGHKDKQKMSDNGMELHFIILKSEIYINI